MHTSSTRTVVTLVLVGMLALTAGCSGLGLGDGDTGATATAESTATDAAADGDEANESSGDDQPDPTEADGSADDDSLDDDSDETGNSDGDDGADGTDGDSDGADANDDNDGDDGNEGDDHEHSDDGDHEHGDDEDETDGSADDSSTEVSGRMVVAVNGSELDLPARDQGNDEFTVDQSDGDTWTANESGLTLAEALSHLDVEASASQMTVDGEQYSEQDGGTTISYRVDGESVDPEEYVLEDVDQIWITVETEETKLATPGEYIRAAEKHAHGEMTLVVDDEEVDFSREKYQSNHRYFHYEHGNGEKWHAHSVVIALEYALSSLDRIDVDGNAIEYNGTTYDADDEGTSIDVTVDGEPVELGEYVLKDGDSVRIVVGSEE